MAEVAAIEPGQEQQYDAAAGALAVPAPEGPFSGGFVAPEAPKVQVPTSLEQMKDESAAWTLANDEQVHGPDSRPWAHLSAHNCCSFDSISR